MEASSPSWWRQCWLGMGKGVCEPSRKKELSYDFIFWCTLRVGERGGLLLSQWEPGPEVAELCQEAKRVVCFHDAANPAARANLARLLSRQHLDRWPEQLAQESLQNWAYEGKIPSQLNCITFLIEPLENVSCAELWPPPVFSSVLAIIPKKLPLTAEAPEMTGTFQSGLTPPHWGCHVPCECA